MPIPAAAQTHFDRAVRNLNHVGLTQPTVEVITGAAAMAHIDVAEGVSQVIVVAADQITAAAASFETTMNSTIARAQQAEASLAKWTKVQGWASLALTLFALAQVVVAVLEFLKP